MRQQWKTELYELTERVAKRERELGERAHEKSFIISVKICKCSTVCSALFPYAATLHYNSIQNELSKAKWKRIELPRKTDVVVVVFVFVVFVYLSR